MRAYGNFSDAGLERLHSVSGLGINRVMLVTWSHPWWWQWHQIGKKNYVIQNATRDDQVTSRCGNIFAPPANSVREKKEKSFNTKAKTNCNWTKTSKLQATCFKQDKKAKVCQGFASTVHFVFAMENSKSMVPWISQIMTKNKTSLLNQNTTGTNWYLCSDLCDMSRTVCWPN